MVTRNQFYFSEIFMTTARMSKFISFIASAILVLSHSAYSEEESQPHTQFKKDLTKIGVIAPLSGGLSKSGHEFVNGVMLAHETYAKESDGGKFLLRVEDDRNSSDWGLAIYEKLTVHTKIDALINFSEITYGAIKSLAENSTIPVVQIGSVPPAANKNIFLIGDISPSEFKGLSNDTFVSNFNARFKTDPSDYARAGYDSYMLIVQSYSSDKTDWVSKIRNNVYKGLGGEIAFNSVGVRKSTKNG